MSTWTDLRVLRNAGHRPALQLAVVSRAQWRLRATLVAVGAMVIDYEPGEPIEAELFADLEVLLLLSTCRDMGPFAAAIAEAVGKPARCRAWCQCSKSLTVVSDPGCEL